tara:strand:- start:164 stop:373 length:210 start_codon:yes stop_codon:yes gene_type:complete
MSDFEYFELRYLEDIAKYIRDWENLNDHYQLRLFETKKLDLPDIVEYLYQYVRRIEESSEEESDLEERW